MTEHQGQCVVAWLERWGERYLRPSQPYVYDQFLLHVGATDMLRRYQGTAAYWHHVQVVLDSFFCSAERAEMCAELIQEPCFRDKEDFRSFLIQARAERRVHALVASVKARTKVRAPLRS